MSGSRSQYIQTFFVPRAGIQFTPRLNVNYGEEELLYMTSAKVADRITNIIIEYMKSINNIPFEIYDCTAGIGGNTLSFLDFSEISKVYSFELRDSRRAMLINNIREYKLDYKSIVNSEFTGISESSTGAVAYFDPEWLSKQIPDLQYSKTEYILENARVGNYLLQEWVVKLHMCSMVLFRVPPGYRFPEISGWKIVIDDDLNLKKNSRLIICLNASFFKTEFVHKPLELKQTLKPVQSNVSMNYSPLNTYNKFKNDKSEFKNDKYNKKDKYNNFNKSEIKTDKTDKYDKSNKFDKQEISQTVHNLQSTTNKYGIPGLFKSTEKQVQTTQQYTKLQPKVETAAEKEQWIVNLYNYLPQLLNTILQNSDIVNKLLESQYLDIWKNSFTDITYDYLNNYETYEILGDTVLETCFTNYLMDRIKPLIDNGAITEEGISNLKMFYMSKINQSNFSKQLGLIEYLRIDPNIKKNIHLSEDLLESFTGALMTVGNKIKTGLGYILCYNFILFLFNNVQIDMKYIYGPPKTQVQQMFKGLGWGEAPVISNTYHKVDNREEITITLSLTDSSKRYLKELNISVPNTFGVGKGNTLKETEYNAYSNGFDTLTKYGLTHEWVIKQKFFLEFNTTKTVEYTEYLQALNNDMKLKSYISINFNIPKSSLGSDIKVVQLLGYKSGFQRPDLLETTYMVETPEIDKRSNLLNTKLHLLQLYLKTDSNSKGDSESTETIGVDWYAARREIDSIRTRNQYEFKNIIDRYLINIFNGIDGYSKAREECVEKSLDPTQIDTATNILNKYSKNPSSLKLNNSVSINAYNFLKSKYPNRLESEYIITTINYCALGFGGQQWALNSKSIQILQNNGINIEAFASPFNNRFTQYCSIFESDKPFNSLGNFFNLDLSDSSEFNVYANPPFVPSILEKTVSVLKNCNTVVLITPTWTDADWYKSLIESGFQAHQFDSVGYESFDYSSNSIKPFIPKFITTIWTRNFDISVLEL